MGQREESVQPAAQMSQEQREIGMAYPQDCLWAPIQFLHQGWLEKKMFQPSGCIMFLRETLLLSKFLSKENKILTCLSTKLLAVRKGGWGFVERGKKNSRTDRALGHCKVLASGSWIQFSAFLTIFLARLRHRWCFLVVATGMKPDECPFAVHDPVELPGPCVNSGTKAFHRTLGKSSVCWVRSGAGSLLPAVEARWLGRGSVGLFADCA